MPLPVLAAIKDANRGSGLKQPYRENHNGHRP